MLQNYLKITWRNLTQNKTLSFVNISGLSLGIAFAILIGMWIQYETSYDTFHKNLNRLAMVQRHQMINHEKVTASGVMLPLYDELKANYPQIKSITRSISTESGLVAGTNKFNKKGNYVDPDFLTMLSFPLVKGNPETALNDPNSIVLTESLAKALFGAADPIGKIVKVDNAYNAQVTAVAKDVPKNSSFSFEYLIPFEFLVRNNPYVRDNRTNWGNSFLQTMVELKEGVSMDAFSKEISPLLANKETKIKPQFLFLHPMAKWRLFDDFKNWTSAGGRIAYVRLFGIIGGFILLIACINFMNLSTARSEKRAKEVGVRKAIGSLRKQLIVQFLTESLFTTFLAFLLALGLIWTLLPYLKNIGLENIRFDFSNVQLLAAVFMVCVVTGIVSGSYPALYLSSFLPVKVLKGPGQQAAGAVSFRKVLVVFQFVISIGLIIGTVIVFQQINHAKNRSVGYDTNNLITLTATNGLLTHYNAVKQQLLNSGHIQAVAKVSSPMTRVQNDWNGFTWEGKNPNESPLLDLILTEWDYEKAASLKFITGRPFSREFGTDSNAVILNETALKLMGFKDPIGKTIRDGDRVLNIVGVIQDVVMRDPFKPVPPAIIQFSPDYHQVVLVRLKQGDDLKKTLATVRRIIEKYDPASPFEYSFVNEEFDTKFATENQVATLTGIFAGLAILISCLGLFGLTMFMAERRSKEISIRKVLGASVLNLWLMLSREFIWLVTIACLIASPLAWWAMSRWLEKYDYRIEIGWPVFAIAGTAAVAVALATISTQAINAAIANPVERLKAE
ncbi:duplicated orphan permease [Dyadobacter sp. SG02]|uniref:ABC transporter permease n=1 Tax=Dyadobacter sp. SG02 TaxID=1855291 RepID=UPI0008D8807F|nr:ABC transporter permease [Dyadobacter sp. SG02]SEI52127.1 duplicated orphan permease [Dyadobacter sp. SG02]